LRSVSTRAYRKSSRRGRISSLSYIWQHRELESIGGWVFSTADEVLVLAGSAIDVVEIVLDTPVLQICIEIGPGICAIRERDVEGLSRSSRRPNYAKFVVATSGSNCLPAVVHANATKSDLKLR
jgi:hypothetical protein